MCHADSLLHPCGHSGTQWTYCRMSRLSGKGTAPPECNDRTWGNSIVSNEHCPLAYCNFKPGSSWTCCACGGSGNREGWCHHDRGRWERDSNTGWTNWVDKCEHNCCTNCTRDFQDETVPLQHAKSAAAQKSGKSSGLKKGTRKTKMSSGPEDVPLPSIEADEREHHDADGLKKSKSSKPSTTSKRKQ